MKNLRCAGTIAGESSQAYKDIVTISMVILFFKFLKHIYNIILNYIDN